MAASLVGHTIDGTIYFPRVGMIKADQPQKRSILSIKAHEGYIGCSNCSLPSRLPAHPNYDRQSIESYDDNQIPASNPRSSQLNTDCLLIPNVFSSRKVRDTILSQPHIARHDFDLSRNPYITQPLRRRLMSHSDHPYPPGIAAFCVLGSTPFSLYRIISFDKLHVHDLGVLRHFCDLGNTLIKDHTSRSVSRSMGILNDRYCSIPHPPIFQVTCHF